MATLTNSDFNYTGNPVTETGAAALTRHVYDDSNNLVATLTAEAFNGVSQLDYAPIAQTLFKNQETQVWTTGARQSCYAHNPHFLQNIGYADYNLQARVKIESNTYTFLRGVKQRENMNLELLQNFKPLSALGTIHCWKDPQTDMYYPATIYLDGFNSNGIGIHPRGATTVASAYDIIELTKVAYPMMVSVCVKTSKQYAWYYDTPHIEQIWTANNNILDIRQWTKGGGSWVASSLIKTMIRHDTPKVPFYVRWINNDGKWDYWMFQPKATINRTLTVNDYYEEYDGKGVQTSYNKEGKEIIEVSTGVQDLDIVKAISLIAYSPVVQVMTYHTGTAGIWMPLQIDKADSQWMTDEPTSELTLSFLLPTPQINK